MKRIGITGAGGNVGSTIVKGLSEKYDLSLYDIKPLPKDINHKSFKLDFADPGAISGAFNGIDALIHLSGDPRPDAPEHLTFRNNFIATSNVFEESRRAGVKKIVFASSNFYHQGSIQEALQGRLKQMITLDMLPTPNCPYAMSKVYGENLGLHFSTIGIQFVALRIGWTVPEDNPALYGGAYMRAMFCSKMDLVMAFDKALEIDTDYLAAFAISNNTRKIFDLTETMEKLKFIPQDDAENYFS